MSNPTEELSVLRDGYTHLHEAGARAKTLGAMISASGPGSRVSLLQWSEHFSASPVDLWLLVEKPWFHKHFSQ